MGEMIKFGIKVGLTIACAAALVASFVILFSVVSDLTTAVSSGSGVSFISDIFGIVSTVLPFNFYPLIAILTTLFSFKVSYWVADKTIVFIDAMG